MSGFLGSMLGSTLGSMGGKIKEQLGQSLGGYLSSEQGIQTILEQARKAGLEDRVRSWIGTGENLPISADELRALLTDEQVQMLVSKTGLPATVVMPALAKFLPEVVDQQTGQNSTTEPAA